VNDLLFSSALPDGIHESPQTCSWLSILLWKSRVVLKGASSNLSEGDNNPSHSLKVSPNDMTKRDHFHLNSDLVAFDDSHVDSAFFDKVVLHAVFIGVQRRRLWFL